MARKDLGGKRENDEMTLLLSPSRGIQDDDPNSYALLSYIPVLPRADAMYTQSEESARSGAVSRSYHREIEEVVANSSSRKSVSRPETTR